MTRISTRKSVEIQPNNKLSDTDTKIRVITGRHDRRKQTLKTILRDEAPVFLAHEEVVVSNNLKKGRKSSKNRLKGEDLSRPPPRGGLTETKTRCIQVTEEVGKALRTGAWQNRKEDIGSLSCRNKQPTNCDSDIMSVDSAVSRKRVNTNIPPHKESTPTMLSKVRENRKASRCCAECKSVVFDRDKLRLRGALGVKICDSCWSKKKPKEVHVATQPVLPRATSPTVKKCLVKLFDVSRYPAGHPFGKGFLSQRSLKRRFNESQVVLNDTANEMIVQPKRPRRGGSSTFPVEFVNTSKEQQCKDGKQIFEINSRQLNETGAKERTRAASNSRNVSSVTTDVTTSNKNEKSCRRTSDQVTAENTEQEKLGKKLSVSPLKVNAQRLPERRVSRKNSLSTETVTKMRTSRRSSSNNESASEKKTLRKNGLNTEVSSEKRTIQKGSENVESSTEKSERSSMSTEISSERKSRRSSMNAEITSQKKTPQRTKMMVETASEKMVSRSSGVNAEIEGGKKTSRRSSTSTETTPARVSRRNSINTETASEIRILRRNSNETSGTRTKRGSSISNNLSKSALPVRIQSKNENLPGLLRKGQKQVISSGKAKIALSKLETKGDRNTSKIRLSQIRSVALRKMLPEAAVAKSSLTNNKKTQLILEKNKPNTVISRKGSVLPKYSKPGERPRAKSVLTRKTGNDFKNRKSLSHGESKSVFGKITTVQHIKKSDVNTLDTSPLSEKTAASRKRKMDLPDKSPGVKKRKVESVPVRRKQTAVEKEFTRAKNLTYKCDMCNNKYSSLAEERLHELSHTGRQPVLVLHKCDSPQGVLSLIREDDFSSLNICSSDSEIQKGVTYEMNMTYDGNNTEMNAEADIGTVQTVERKDEDTDAIQVENLENTDEERKSNVNKSLEMVETGEMHDTDHEKCIPFDNCDTVPVLKKQDIEHSQKRIRSDADICPPAEMDKNKTDPILENSKASKAEIESSKESSSVCSPEIAKKPKSSDEIAVLLEEIFGESSEEDLISVTGIRNLRQTADAVNSGIDKTSQSSMEKPPYGMNTLQHTSVTQNLATVVPSETAEAVTQYLKGETHNPEEILHQLNYGDKIVVENEAKTDTKTSSDTDQADTNIKLPGDVELNNSHKDWDSEGGSPETSSVNNIEGEVTKLKAFEDDDGNRKQLVDNESKVIDGSQLVQSHDKTVCLNSAKESNLELSTDITDNKNQNLEDSTQELAVGENNVLEDKTSDDMRMTDEISLGGNKDFPNSVTNDDSVVSVKGSIVSESSCKQSQIETVNQNVGHHDAYCIDSAGASPQHKYKVDSGDKHSIPVIVESVNEEEQQATDKEKQVMLDTTNSTVTHEIVETCNNDKCDESELPSEIHRDDETVLECNDKDTVLECHKKEQVKSDKIFHPEDITQNVVNEEQVDKKPIEIMEGETGSEINGKIIIEQVECVDNSDLLNKQKSDEVREIAKIESNASEKCNTNTSVETISQPENETHAVGEVTPPTDLVLAANNENEVNSTKDSLEDVLQNEICEDEAGATENGLIKDVLLVENKEANEMLNTASDDIVGVTETGSRSIEVHSPSEADTVECMEIESEKNSNDTASKLDELNCHKYICDSSEVKDSELDLVTQPDGVCDASQETDSSYKGTVNTTCDVSSKLDNKIVVSDSGHDIEYEEISATLDSGPELKIDNIEQEVESADSGHNLDALNASHEAENGLQTETLDTEHEQQVLNPNNELSIQFASQKIQTLNDGLEMKATNDTNSKDACVDDCSPCSDHDGTNNSDESHQVTVQESAKEGTPVDVDQRAQSVDSTNLVDTKESEMEPLISNCGVDTTGKSEVVETGRTTQEIEITDSSRGTQKVVSTCEDKTDDDANCKIETEDVNSEAEVEKARQGLETASANHEVELVSASEVASNEVVVALDASSEGDALVSGDEVGTDIPFVPTSDLSTNSEITAGISDCCPSLVGVENLSFNVRHTVPDVFEEDEQILQEVADHSILQEPDCADRNVETLTKGQNEIQEAEIADNVKPPLAVGLNGMNEKVIDECRTKMRGDSDEMLKDNLNLPDSGDNDIAGLEPISDDELDFM